MTHPEIADVVGHLEEQSKAIALFGVFVLVLTCVARAVGLI